MKPPRTTMPLRIAFAAAMLAPIASGASASPDDASGYVTLRGNHAQIGAQAIDAGPVDGAHVLPHVLLAMKRPAVLQQELDTLLAAQQDRASPRYHAWLTAADLRRFGPAQADIDRVTSWLRGEGLSVNDVSPSGMTIDFGGAVSRIAAVFHTPIHAYVLHGEHHLANTVDVAIPVPLVDAVAGVTLSNFFPRPNLVPKSNVTVPTGSGNTPAYLVAPADFQTIYNATPLLNGTGPVTRPVTGIGITIAVVEQSDILARDWQRFRQYFGLSSYSGQLSTIHPGKCGDPGRIPDEVEAVLDAEWSGAVAPDTDVVVASCPQTETTFGVMTSLQNLVEGTDTNATIYSISYGGCEQEQGLPFLQMWANLVEEGAAEGKSILISSGDSGSACDRDVVDRDGLGVNGLAANGFVTSVGGTDFYDTALGKLPEYWTRPNGGDGHGTARSYVPEIPWDNSCANSVLAAAAGASSGLDYCNTNPTAVQNGVGGSGGASLLYAKPDWQSPTLPGVPNDGVRDQPDVSFFAANGIWDHAYLICFSDAAEGGSPCAYKGISPSTGLPNAFAQAVGGTSVSTPAFAGILALETQIAQVPLGNPAPRLYALAHLQYTNPVLAKSCAATLGRDISKACIFNVVTAGDNAEACVPGTPDCHTMSRQQSFGVLSTKDGTSKIPAYPAQQGYSLATGLGSINITNLVESY